MERTRGSEVLSPAVRVMASLIPHFFFEIHHNSIKKKNKEHVICFKPSNRECKAMQATVIDSHDVVALVEALHIVAPAEFLNVINQQLFRCKVVPSPDTYLG